MKGPDRRLALVVPLLALGACGGEENGAGEALPPPVVGYSLDSLAWFQEGRPVRLAGRDWVPVGQPVAIDADSLEAVGSFEEMELYAPREESAPFQHLFFPYGNGIWQTLEPAPEPRPADSP